MPCYHPLVGYRAAEVNKSGKRGIVFKKDQSLNGQEVQLPCGQCIGCRLERSRQWALRMMHESSLYTENSFITLTYAPEHVPENYGLDKTHFQKFMKRLRKQNAQKTIRFFHCGEYGEGLRPHYHACLFNHDFKDRVHIQGYSHSDIYTSDSLSKLWPFGFSSVGNLTFESAAYVARYVVKKVTGKQIEQGEQLFGLSPYNRCDPLTGELFNVPPEYATMSRRPGIGRKWYEKYSSDCYPSDTVIMRGKKMQPPKYYDTLYPDIQDIKKHRKKCVARHKENQTPERLRIRETIKMAQADQLKRSI